LLYGSIEKLHNHEGSSVRPCLKVWIRGQIETVESKMVYKRFGCRTVKELRFSIIMTAGTSRILLLFHLA